MTIEDAPQAAQDSAQEAHVSEEEAMYVSGLYDPLIELYDTVEARNRAIIEGNMTAYVELSDEMMGDM